MAVQEILAEERSGLQAQYNHYNPSYNHALLTLPETNNNPWK